MSRKTSRFRTLRESSAHKHGPAAMKPDLFYPHRRRLRPGRWVRMLQALSATLAFPAAALLPASCEAPASPVTAASSSPLPAAPSAPPPAALEVPRISGLPNMAQIERRLNDQYAKSAQETPGVEFDPPSISGTTVSASITYAEGKFREMEIGDNKYDIKTITITREVDGKTIPTRVEYKDKDDTTRKTITSRYFQPDDPANNVQQSLEGGAQLSEAAAEGHKLNIRGEEKDAADKILRTFEATEEIRGGKIILRTTYSPDKEGFTEIVTTENGIPTRKEVIYPDKEAAAKNIKTETITYENPPSAIFYPDPDGKEIKRDTVKNDGSILTTMRDKSTITTTTTAKGGTLAVHKNPDGTETRRLETKGDGSTIETTPTEEGGTLVVNKDAEGRETSRVETRTDKSTITTTYPEEGRASELVIHSSVTAIENNAFYSKKLTSVIIGNSVKRIGEEAFHHNQLAEVILPEELYNNRGTVFDNNPPGLKFYKYDEDQPGKKGAGINVDADDFVFITMPDGSRITTKDDGSRHLVIADGIKTIGEGAFWDKRLTSVVIPPSVTEIGESAFKGSQLAEVILPKALYNERGTAFDDNPEDLKFYEYDEDQPGKKGAGLNADGSTFITMPDGSTITTKDDGSRHLVIADGIKTIGKGAFQSSRLTSVVIPPSVTEIGESAFKGNQLTSLTIPPSVTEIGKEAFERNQLTSLIIGNGVKTIGAYAFYNNKLAEIILPKELYNERGTAFYNNLEDLKFYEYDADKPGKKGVALNINADGLPFITMPDGSTIATGLDGSRHLVIADGIETIGAYAFQRGPLTSLTIPPSVTEIGEGAFRYSKLTSLTIPPSVTSIGKDAFAYNDLTSLTIGNGVKTIGDNAFAGNQLTSLTIPPSVTEIGKEAFERNQLTSLIIGNGVKAIGWGAFRDNKLTSLTIPPSVTEIGRVAFANNRLTSLTIGNGVKTIGDYAFYNNQLAEVILPKELYEARGNTFGSNPKGLKFYEYDTDKTGKKGAGLNADGPTFITMPNGSTITTKDDGSRHLVIADDIKTIGKGAFQSSRLTSVVIPPSVTEIGRGAFWHNKLTSLTIGNGVKTIGWGAFRDNKLTSLTIPPSVTEIGKEAFANNRLTSLIIGNGVKTIGDYAFYNNQLEEVILPKELYEARGNAFGSNPKGLKFYEYDADKPGKKGAGLNADGSTFITMPDGSTITTKDDGSRHLVIADGIETIRKEAFANNRLTSVILSKALYEARGGAFNGNPATLQFPDRKGSALGTN